MVAFSAVRRSQCEVGYRAYRQVDAGALETPAVAKLITFPVSPLFGRGLALERMPGSEKAVRGVPSLVCGCGPNERR
ncbi:hypothetical protein CHELA1G11_11467 [Hyphomicrobiales bacterium]|nr:hypothetical protein CHELA1G11_11467 [Hyphomicrobiales bacterium]CAH1667561.1 hypothetical protein CHELA1G2_12842 [Hyphomicrobiales bacterium]